MNKPELTKSWNIQDVNISIGFEILPANHIYSNLINESFVDEDFGKFSKQVTIKLTEQEEKKKVKTGKIKCKKGQLI